MNFLELSIKNYHGISSLNMAFDKKLTVIVGRNGAGKTTILDALVSTMFMLNNLWTQRNGQFSNSNNPYIDNDLFYGQEKLEVGLKFLHPSEPFGEIDSTFFELLKTHQKGGATGLNNNFWSLRNTLQLNEENRPLLAYYRQNRGFQSNAGHTNGLQDKWVVITNSIAPNIQAISDLGQWWDRRDADEARKVRDNDPKHRDPQLQAIRHLVREIDSFDEISYSGSKNPDGLYLTKSGGVEVHVDSLSSGERSYIILLADLARRLQVLHPDKKLKEIPGVILIDEIELNLHPRWQSVIVPTLRKVFASCQFIITTHSPQVLSGIKAKHIRILKNKNGRATVETPLNTKGRTSNYLLEGIFGAEERFPEVDKVIEEFNNAIDNSDLDQATTLLETIHSSIEGDPVELIAFGARLNKLRGTK